MTRHENRLVTEKSPYLLQHAHNPVDWHPWGEEAFAAARERDVPLFVSSGYATCHWCHVMERECFEDEDVARLMNEAFVCVKVDREERPDVDAQFMTACQMLTGGGGWPLNVLLTPQGKPFFAATYIPRQSMPGRLGMLDLVPRISQIWREERGKAENAAEQIVRHMHDLERASAEGGFGPDAQDTAARRLAARFDSEHGGFGEAPKFPTPHQLLFLLRQHRRTGETHLLQMVEKTLTAMRLGGIWDHAGFGFHRYSTDERWLLPHFEKMLYDQAMLLMAYSEAYDVTGEPLFARTAREIGEYLLRDLRDEGGAFHSAEDADSEGEEGRFYVWSKDELQAVLGPDAAFAAGVFGVEAQGNFEDEATRERTGANVLHFSMSPEAMAGALGMDEDELLERLEGLRERLFAARARRVRPALDDKVLADWNGLAIAALARAGRAVEPSFAQEAERAARFILAHMRMPDGRLMHRWRDGQAAVPGLLADYAFLAHGLIELSETLADATWLGHAVSLARIMLDDFEDREHGGFFMTATGGDLPVRQKDIHDAALPSGNSMALIVLRKLARVTGHEDFDAAADRLLAHAGSKGAAHPEAFTMLLCGLFLGEGGADVIVTGRRDAEDTRLLLDVAQQVYAPEATFVFRDADDPKPAEELCPLARGRAMQDGRATAYVCRAKRHCEEPATDPEVFARLLAAT